MGRATIRAGGQTFAKSEHLLTRPHPEMTDRIMARVLENWVIAGNRQDPETGKWSRNYMAEVRELGKMAMVAISLEADSPPNFITTSHPIGKLTGKWRKGDLDYFYQRFQDVEVRDE